MKKYDTSIYRGVFVALNACYDANDEVNIPVMRALTRKYCDLGVNGVYLCGSTGEGLLLTLEERMKIAEAVQEEVGGEMTVIVHVGTCATREAQMLARHAERIGVNAVSAVPSIYYRLSEASIEAHWDGIMEASDLPFFIYNIPSLTGYDLSMNLFQKMAAKEKVVGVKNSSDSTYQIERFKKLGGEGFVVFNGPDEQFLAGRLMGASAGIGGTYGTMPEMFLACNHCIETGDIPAAQMWQGRINDCISQLLSFPSLYGASKAVITRRYGIDAGLPRLPFLPTAADDPKMIALADQIDIYAKEALELIK